MLFFRSEECVREWCAAKGYPLRPRVSMDQLWGLAVAWYGTRLQPDSRRPQPAEVREIFGRLGLVGEFWDPQSDAFGSERAAQPRG
jgi:hypothetical protein